MAKQACLMIHTITLQKLRLLNKRKTLTLKQEYETN
ncbi:uncharacterized protein G2W53_042107 [Senna tora]|uniref:Uncharacterized protein n=1 Tax=Senna tora TaxID=362788 RepID=A0A834SGA3_9FABA|nr:uncharacterized protein G2W53_042107 [Senna tora]